MKCARLCHPQIFVSLRGGVRSEVDCSADPSGVVDPSGRTLPLNSADEMKVAFLVGPFPSLSETFILNQITGLIDRGHEVHVYGWPSEDEEVHEDIRRYGLLERTRLAPAFPESRVERVVKALRFFGQLIRADLRALHALNVVRYGRIAASLRLLYASARHVNGTHHYDVAHCHFAPNGIIGIGLRDAGLLRARRIVTTFHGRDVHVGLPKFAPRVRHLLFERGDGFTVNSEYTAKSVVDLGGRETDICKLPVGLEVDRFDFQKRTRAPGEPVRVLTVGRLVEKKGIEYAIRATAQLSDEIDVTYRIVGGGPLRGELERLARRLDVADFITFLGALPHAEVQEQYRWAHLFTLPSVTASNGDQEGQGLVLQEAQACGLPVVATRHNGFPDSVGEESALLVPERDSCALAQALRQLVQQEARWPEMGTAGRSFVERNFDIQILNDRLVEIYQGL